jgi:hypothetical protein
MASKTYEKAEISTIETLNKRAKAKFIQEPVIMAMIALDSKFASKYKDTLHCSEIIYHKGQELTSRYCGHRWCRVCNRIRTGKLINGYTPALDQMPDKNMVTLTIKNVPAAILRQTIIGMNQTIRKIQEYRRKVLNLPGVNAIRKLECTYNVESDNYHPHYHIITSTIEEAEFIRNQWLDRRPDANHKGQDIREAYKPMELFKYFAKLTSGAASYVSANGRIKLKNEYHYPEALDIIFQAIQGLRIVQPMGQVKLVREEIDTVISELADETVTQEADANQYYLFTGENWASPFTGEVLTSYVPLLTTCIYRKKIRYLQAKPTG